MTHAISLNPAFALEISSEALTTAAPPLSFSAASRVDSSVLHIRRDISHDE